MRERPQRFSTLRDFKVLETLCCNWDDIVPDLNEDLWGCEEGKLTELSATSVCCQKSGKEHVFDLAAILPTSLKYLGLRNCPAEGSLVMTELLESGLERLPNLKRICVIGNLLGPYFGPPGLDHKPVKALAREKGLEWLYGELVRKEPEWEVDWDPNSTDCDWWSPEEDWGL